ncbi:hypothetical protein GCM10009808_04260 [Microbacterium sediminicola]|uniref:General stress protein 17M-like domain-containing protein n=2 Tax=Microbacterium sediminicola TaxID=415210 RepID=A0ABN2HMW3_9MICO
MMGGQFPRGLGEVGQTVASFSQYEAAQKAVSTLIAADIPAREIAIVGQGLRSIERVTGRLGYATAARSGAINGLLLGMLFSAIFVLGSPTLPVQAFIGVLFLGIAIGMLASLLTFAIVRRRRDYASVMQVVAEHYDIAVADASAGKARQLLGQHATPVARPVDPVDLSEPPRYGQRIDPATGAPVVPADAADTDAEPAAALEPKPTADTAEPSSADEGDDTR